MESIALLKAKMVLQPIRKLCSPTAFEPENKKSFYNWYVQCTFLVQTVFTAFQNQFFSLDGKMLAFLVMFGFAITTKSL